MSSSSPSSKRITGSSRMQPVRGSRWLPSDDPTPRIGKPRKAPGRSSPIIMSGCRSACPHRSGFGGEHRGLGIARGNEETPVMSTPGGEHAHHRRCRTIPQGMAGTCSPRPSSPGSLRFPDLPVGGPSRSPMSSSGWTSSSSALPPCLCGGVSRAGPRKDETETPCRESRGSLPPHHGGTNPSSKHLV